MTYLVFLQICTSWCPFLKSLTLGMPRLPRAEHYKSLTFPFHWDKENLSCQHYSLPKYRKSVVKKNIFCRHLKLFFFKIVRNEEEWCKESCYTWVGQEGGGEGGLSLENPTKSYNSQCLQPMKILMTELKLSYAGRSQLKFHFMASEHG